MINVGPWRCAAARPELLRPSDLGLDRLAPQRFEPFVLSEDLDSLRLTLPPLGFLLFRPAS